MRPSIAGALVLALAGCSSPAALPPDGAPAGRADAASRVPDAAIPDARLPHADAAAGPADAAAPDAPGGRADATPRAPDAALPDARRADAARPPPDAATPDAPPPDAATPDAPPPDAAMSDAPRPDAAPPIPDAAPADAAPLPILGNLGLDMFSLLRAYTGWGADDADGARHAMDLARARGFTYARFMAAPFWPSEMTTSPGWLANPDAYFAAFDQLIRDARARGLRLVPSLMWNVWLFPDVAGEPRGQLFVPGSATRQLAERYVSEVVLRYKDDPTILFWELGNEYNLDADQDYGTVGCDACGGAAVPSYCLIAPSLGTPCKRTSADDYYSCNACRGVSSAQQDLGELAGAFAALIHDIDPDRGVSTGFSYPRQSAYHLSVSPCPDCDFTWDSPAQYQQVLDHLHPPGVDIMSVHHYWGLGMARFGDSDVVGAALLARTQELAGQLGKTFYVGEYGEPNAGSITCDGQSEDCGGDPDKQITRRIMDALVANRVPYSGIWTFEDHQCPGEPTCFTVGPDDPIVADLVAHEEAYAECGGAGDGTPCSLGLCEGGSCVPTPGTPPLATPTTVKEWSFAQPSGLSGWSAFTSCTACTPGTFAFVGDHAEVQSHALGCSPPCTNPGVYLTSPSVPLAPGTLTVSFSAHTSASDAILHLEGEGAPGGGDVSIESRDDFATGGATFALPPGTTGVHVRLELKQPDSTLDVQSIVLEEQ